MADKTNKKKLYGAAMGLLDPLLQEGAKKIASKVAPKSPLRGLAFRETLGVINGFMEAVAGDLPPVIGAVMEKSSDFFDFFGQALTGVEKKEKEEKIAKAKDWMENFFSSAAERLTKSQVPKDELEKIKLEFELRRELLKFMEEAMNKKEPKESVLEEPVPPKFNFEEWKKKFSDLTAKYWPNIKKNTTAADKEIAKKIWEFHGWLARKGVR